MVVGGVAAAARVAPVPGRRVCMPDVPAPTWLCAGRIALSVPSPLSAALLGLPADPPRRPVIARPVPAFVAGVGYEPQVLDIVGRWCSVRWFPHV